jgi:hypothetical protein
MTFHVPANQTVSYSVYLQTVSKGYPHEFIKTREKRISQAFDAGEPIWMLEPELELYFEAWKQPKEKTPLQLARRVVRL